MQTGGRIANDDVAVAIRRTKERRRIDAPLRYEFEAAIMFLRSGIGSLSRSSVVREKRYAGKPGPARRLVCLTGCGCANALDRWDRLLALYQFQVG
jgi:hypothetical protein